jgi:hypothetical protein
MYSFKIKFITNDCLMLCICINTMPIQWLKLAHLITATMLGSYPLICQWPIMFNWNRFFQHSCYAVQSRTEISILTNKNKNLCNYTKLHVSYIKSDQCQTKNIKFLPRDYTENSKNISTDKHAHQKYCITISSKRFPMKIILHFYSIYIKSAPHSP